MPQPKADDEVAELARTLDEMLQALDSARGETEATLARQRRFVADASHELRTPLTSVLANLELLADTLDGEQGEAASSALRSSRRMRRLVADLLLLARADVGRSATHEPTDLAGVLVEAAAELEPVSDRHEITVDAEPAIVDGARDELHRVALNLIENAIRHNPPGTQVRAATSSANGHAVLTVEDDGVGHPRRHRADGVRALRARRGRARRLGGPGPRDRARRGRVPRRQRLAGAPGERARRPLRRAAAGSTGRAGARGASPLAGTAPRFG